MHTVTLTIQGMSCEACVGHVTRALQALNGVQSAEVSLQENNAVVVYDPDRMQIAQMLEAVADEGYEAARPT